MPSALKAPPKPDPTAQAVGIDDQARRQAEMERRRRGSYYSAYQSNSPVGSQMTGGAGSQTLG